MWTRRSLRVALVGAVAGFVGGAVAAAAEPLRIGPDLRVQPLQAGAWVIVHERPWAANSLLVETADETLVLCDTPYDDRATHEVLRWIRDRFGKRRIVATNSHFHGDALGGNGALRAAGIATYGSDLTVRMLAERGPQERTVVLVKVDPVSGMNQHRIGHCRAAPTGLRLAKLRLG